MGAIHDRWEIVEALLVSYAFRDISMFQRGASECALTEAIAHIRSGHLVDDAAIAHALEMRSQDDYVVFARKQPLHAVLRETAERWLVASGDSWVLRADVRQPGLEILRWRGATMLLPPSLIVAGALSGTDRSGPSRVQVLPVGLAPDVDIAHLHVHLGPMLPFESLWIQLQYAFLRRRTLDADPGSGIESVQDMNVPQIGRHVKQKQSGMNWQWLLELAFASRLWMNLETRSVPPSSVLNFARGRIELAHRGRSLMDVWSGKEIRDLARKVLRVETARRTLENRRSARTPVWAYPPTASSSAVRQAVGGPLELDLDDTAVEIAFLAKALRRCSIDHDGSDETFARVFYQYLRVKVALYSHLVVDPWNSGLRHFLDVVQRDGPYTSVIDDSEMLERIRLRSGVAEAPLKMRALEIHVPPGRWLSRPPSFGASAIPPRTWILSFPRAPKVDHSDPDGTRATSQWRRMMARAGTTCRVIARCLAMRPALLKEVRGLSLMDWERVGPVWLFETPFRRLIDASARVAAGHPRLKLKPLRTALHLGEDFDHLLSGLRQIAEPMEWGLVSPGDRIGHALALGILPEGWCEKHPWVRMRPWDRILDLGFSYWAFHNCGMSLAADQVERMRAEADRVIASLFNVQDWDPLEIARSLWLALPRGGFLGAGDPRQQKARELIARIMDHGPTGRKALTMSVSVETKLELPLIKAIHGVVHDRVTGMRVAVEVNPSSNLLIGGFRSVFEQPVFHTSDIPMTLNADDPLTFATTLADDYAYAWAGMVLGSGKSPHEATQRLEEAARCSMRYVFS